MINSGSLACSSWSLLIYSVCLLKVIQKNTSKFKLRSCPRVSEYFDHESASFFPDPKISLSTQGNRICQSTPSDGIRIHFRETRPTSCAAILVYCSVRTGHRFVTSSESKISRFAVHTLSDSLRIYLFPLWRAD